MDDFIILVDIIGTSVIVWLVYINGLGNATVSNAMGESNYSCTGPLSLTCATIAIDGSIDESVTIRRGEFTILNW